MSHNGYYRSSEQINRKKILERVLEQDIDDEYVNTQQNNYIKEVIEAVRSIFDSKETDQFEGGDSVSDGDGFTDRVNTKSPISYEPKIVKDPKIKEHRVRMKTSLAKIFSYLRFRNGQINWLQLNRFEPKTWNQKISSLFQNTFECRAVLAMILLSSILPSLVSVGLTVLSHNLIFSSTYQLKTRIKVGLIFMLMNIIILSQVVRYKMQQFHMVDGDQEFRRALGIKEDIKWSFAFEIALSLLYLRLLFRYILNAFYIHYLEKNRVSVVMLKNYEFQLMLDELEDAEPLKPDEPLKIGNNARFKKKEQKLDAMQLYHQDVKKIRQKLRISYLECNYFKNKNKVFFLMMIFFQLAQSMIFNCISDVPQLIIIIGLATFFTLRKKQPILYARMTFYVVGYVQVFLTIKLLFAILVQISYAKNLIVQYWIIDYAFIQSLPTKRDPLYVFYLLSSFACLICCQLWKQAKWIDIYDKTCLVKNRSFCKSTLQYYFENCSKHKSQNEKFDAYLKAQKKLKQLNRLKLSIYGRNDDLISRFKNDVNKYFPTLVLWVLRVFLVFQCYLYHTNLSMIHLAFVLSSFIFTAHFTLFISAFFMVPLYTWEFVMIFGSKIDLINQSDYYKRYSSWFIQQQESPILEQSLYYVILLLFFMTFSAFKLIYEHDQNDFIKNFFADKIASSESSVIWKFIFFMLKYIQTLVLVSLFINGSDNLNNMRNIGFMIFFVIYTTSEYLYRKTSKLLTIFISFFILGQYYFSLNYMKYINNESLLKTLKWLNLFQDAKAPSWHEGEPIYFRHTPYAYDWIVLLMLQVLKLINNLFVDPLRTQVLLDICYEKIRDRFFNLAVKLMRLKNALNQYLIIVVVACMFYFIRQAQSNLINWIFFVLNMLMFSFIAKGDDKDSTNKHSRNIAYVIKFYSMIILMIDIAFICLVGNIEKKNQPDSLDQQIKRAYPKIYDHLSFIGLREQVEPGTELTEALLNDMFRFKFYSYIAFFMISQYLILYFQSRIDKDGGLEAYDNREFEKIFQFETDTVKISVDASRKMLEERVDQSHQIGKLASKASYSQYDFLEIYEKVRFSTTYKVYQMMDWWPILDMMASYGHIFSNLTIVILGIYYNVSFFMFFNICCVCVYYTVASVRLYNRALKSFRTSGLQNQTDVKISSMVTKRYKIGAFYEFLTIRHSLWKVQFSMLVLACCIGFPSTVLQLLRKKLYYEDKEYHQQSLERIDFWVFYIYMLGIFKDDRLDIEHYFYLPMTLIAIALFFERQSINWLTNRQGCTYYYLQKCIEIDLRKQSLKDKWEICPPIYSIDAYRQNYFGYDFEELKNRFQEDLDTMKRNRIQSKKHLNEIRDFVPYKIAKRIRDFVTFTVKLNGRCQDVKIDEKTQQMLITQDQYYKKLQEVQYNKQNKLCNIRSKNEYIRAKQKQEYEVQTLYNKLHSYDYESFPILREYKINFLKELISEAVDRKYKISFHKGMQFAFEALIVFVLMISIVLKSNILSVIYLLFVFKYIQIRQKTQLLVHLVVFISITFILQYFMLVINLTHHVSPSPYPFQFAEYPVSHDTGELNIKYLFPVFYKIEIFKDLRLTYLIGVTVERQQVKDLFLDFFNLFLISMYIYHYRNPVMVKQVEKIFWCFPTRQDSNEKWSRLDKKVKIQLNWLNDPVDIDQKVYDKLRKKLYKSEIAISKDQYTFAMEYHKLSNYDINQTLIDYIDLKYNQIWSDGFCSKIKQQFKQQSFYFRIVKQGSILVYITFHIMTIFMILLMATLRQSVISFIYILITIPRIKDLSNVLIQRDIHLDVQKIQLKHRLDELQQKIDQNEKDIAKNPHDIYLKQKNGNLRNELNSTQIQFMRIQEKQQSKTFEQKQDEKVFKSGKWKIIEFVEKDLMRFAMIDFCLQIFVQMPLIQYHPFFEVVGLRKVWILQDPEDLSFKNLVSNDNFEGFELSWYNLWIQCMNCVIICFISVQIEIFKSFGFEKFVTQKNGSMDLLVSLATLKSKSISYVYNNKKIRKIISIQRRKETILATVEKLKQKLKRWRIFTRSTLNADTETQNIVPSSNQYVTPTNANPNSLRSSSIRAGDFLKPMLQDAEKQVAFEKQRTHIHNHSHQAVLQKKVSKADAEVIFDQLAKEFVLSKKQKLNLLSKLYLFLHKYFVEQIMLKNNYQALKEFVDKHSQGEIFTPSELDQLMYDEAMELIQQKFDHKEGSYALYNLFRQKQGKNLLGLTNFDKQIKLKQMKRTWAFTRTSSMLLKLVETFFYIIISNSQNLIYFSMILSMYCNAGLISIPYPILVFGYAMLEETRPRKEFWKYIRQYTQFLLIVKFLANLSIFCEVMESETFLVLQGYVKIGIYDYDSLGELVFYMIPEIMIIIFVMLNEIQLKLIGMYYMLEQDHESINDGIQRNLLKGDAEKVKQNKIVKANMQLCRFYASRDCQLGLEIQILMERKKKEELEDFCSSSSELEEAEMVVEPLTEEKQLDLLKSISLEIAKSSRQFDIDISSSNNKSSFDNLIFENIIQKSLENDNLIYVEGRKNQSMDMLEFEQEMKEEISETISAGDFPNEFINKIKAINESKQPQISYFEKHVYFDSLFPSLKIQKPGYDLYGSTTIIQSILAIYVFLYYGQISVDQVQFIDSIKNNNSIFKGEMALILIIIIFTIIIERYVNRSDTKAVKVKGLSQDGKQSSTFFNQEEMFQRNNTQRQMTIQLKTMRTTDLDMQGTSAQEYLQTMYGDDQQEEDHFDETRTKITTQQKTKFVMHWILLIGSHILVFWYIPITGNMQLYGQPQCDQQLKEKYGCKNFHDNTYLQVFYILLCIYFSLSAHQLKYGFTIMRKPSSVMQYNDDPLALLGAQVYMGIPFATEIRCLLDFTFNKTSLDVFQFWQLFQYHIELYIAKNGNIFYQHKILGSRTPKADKCLFGVLISSLILTMLIGPIFFFSDLGGFITSNPVNSGNIEIALIINKKTSISEILDNEHLRNQHLDQQQSLLNLNSQEGLRSEVPYFMYQNSYPFLRQYDDEYYSQKSFHNWTETRFFKSDQLQDCIANEYSDKLWDISERSKLQLKRDLLKAVDTKNPNYDVKLGIYYSFNRELPATAKNAKGQQIKTLDPKNLHDCKTLKQIENLALLDCETPTPGYKNNVTIKFTQAYIQNLVLGSTTAISTVVREGLNISPANQKHDLLVEYMCGNQWTIHASKEPTVIPNQDEKYLLVDEQTCEPINKREEQPSDDVLWFRVTFTLFSMMVSASIFASFNITTFYTGVVLVLGSQMRPIFLFGTWRGFVYETTHPDAIIKLIEACYMKRHEEDLIGEEETYRMLQEIVRSPELLKAITGSSLKGSCDPHLDRLTSEDRAKLQHLDLLERKGFDVSKLKQQIRQKKKSDDDYNF